MIRSTNEELGEYELICRPKHVAKVWAAIEAALPRYWTKVDPVAPVFEKAMASYEKEAQKYRRVFDQRALDEFHDDPNAFKQALTRDVPIIANTLRQRRAELREWQIHFRGARANDLLEVFSNVVDFVAWWSDDHPAGRYAKLNVPTAFDLDPLDSDESMLITNVIGMGIKSVVLYHLDPERFPPRGRLGLYGLYFLSGKEHFDLPSESSEFLMVNDTAPAPDGSIIMEHNFYYPYGLFSLYALRVFRWINERAETIGLTLNRPMRYVYVEQFFETVCAQHVDDMKTMRAHERFEIPV